MPGEEVRASNVRHTGVCGGMYHGYVHGLILDCTHCVNWVSLITEVRYRVQWGRKWDRTMGVANSCN